MYMHAHGFVQIHIFVHAPGPFDMMNIRHKCSQSVDPFFCAIVFDDSEWV